MTGERILLRQRDALLRGDLAGVAALMPEVEALVATAAAGGGDPRLRAAAARNRTLLAGVLSAVAERRARAQGLRIYAADGHARAMRAGR
ncbi:hypothetical protein BCF33_2088 [Hasllibacter halocynthiae]|uniref:FlgN protein n=1 Tax=Hasllibacter halocynthiae TaxID=595589 RepID=A0A2T0X2Q6_9RHOB|nr:hypothetical protein [Hasllibacter halocynthiae]PRY93221.1 hypothetical protein BCF33_2088 [Hasllibacter halocynthiae]